MMKNFTHLAVFSIFIILLLILISYQAITYSGGPNAGLTNAPGENNCTSCHSGSLITSGSNWSNIVLNTNIPATGYLPDSIYNITLSHSQSGINTWGFQITSLISSNNNMAGNITITNSAKTQKKTSGSKEYVTHTSSGTSGSGSNSWTYSWKAPSTNVGDIKFYATVNAANGNGNTSGDQIFAKTWTFSVSSLLPTATINASKISVCVGDTVFLTGGGNNNPTSFSWTMTGGTPSSSSAQNPYVIYSTSGTKTISLVTSNTKGKSLPSTVNISVNALPSANISVKGKTNLCPGDSVILSAPSGSGLNYLWNTNEKTQSIIVKTPGTYNVVVTNSSGCKATSQNITINVFTVNQNIITASDDSICAGSNITLTSTTGFETYYFYNGKTLLTSGKSNQCSSSNIANGNDLFSVAQDANGCFSTSNKINVFVGSPQSAPVVKCKNTTTSSIEFEWSSIGNAQFYEVSIDSGKTWKSVGLNTSYLVSGLGYSTLASLHVKAFDNSICKYSEIGSSLCQTDPCSPVVFTIDADTLICKGDSVKVILLGLSNAKYSVEFNYSGFKKDTIYYVKPDETKTFRVEVIDSNSLNCPSMIKSLKIHVEKQNIFLTNNMKNNSLCDGQEVEFSATKGFKEYSFFLNGVVSTTGTNSEFVTSNMKNNDQIYVKGISKEGCEYQSDTQIITVFNLPLVSLISNKINNTICSGDTIKFNGTSGMLYYAFVKNNSDTVQSGKNNVLEFYDAKNNDQIMLFAQDQNGCTGISKVESVKVNKLPNAGFTFSQNFMQFNFSDTTKNVTGRLWSFGDMSTDTSKNPVHTYQSEGKYSVKLNVKDFNECTATISQDVNPAVNSIDDPTKALPVFNAFVRNSDKLLLVNFSLSNTSTVKINLLDINGKVISRLVDANFNKGINYFEYSVGKLPSGTYLIVFESENIVRMIKIVLQ